MNRKARIVTIEMTDGEGSRYISKCKSQNFPDALLRRSEDLLKLKLEQSHWRILYRIGQLLIQGGDVPFETLQERRDVADADVSIARGEQLTCTMVGLSKRKQEETIPRGCC